MKPSHLLSLAPDNTFGDPEKSERFRQMLAYRTLVALRPEKKAAGR